MTLIKGESRRFDLTHGFIFNLICRSTESTTITKVSAKQPHSYFLIPFSALFLFMCSSFGRVFQALHKPLYNPRKNHFFCVCGHLGVSLLPVIPVNSILLGIIAALHNKLRMSLAFQELYCVMSRTVCGPPLMRLQHILLFLLQGKKMH